MRIIISHVQNALLLTFKVLILLAGLLLSETLVTFSTPARSHLLWALKARALRIPPTSSQPNEHNI